MSKPLRKIIVFSGPIILGLVNLTHRLINPPIYREVMHHLEINGLM